MAEEAGEKTFQPTPRKLQKAREKGQVPRSQELAYVVTLAALVLTSAVLAPHLLGWCIRLLEQGLSGRSEVFEGSDAFVAFIGQVALDSLGLAGPLLLAPVDRGDRRQCSPLAGTRSQGRPCSSVGNRSILRRTSRTSSTRRPWFPWSCRLPS